MPAGPWSSSRRTTLPRSLAEIHWDTLSVQTIVWTSAPVDLPVEEHRSWDSLLAEAAIPAREPSSAAPFSYLQGFATSGTTGRTKAVLHSHRNVYVHSFATIQALRLTADDDHCWGHVGPMCHVGDAAFVWIALLLGARHVFHENQLQLEEVGKLLADEHVTIVKLVPSILQLLCGSDRIRALKFPALRWILTGGAAPDPALVHRTATLFGCDLIQGFGMTEATCHVAFKVETQAPMKEGLRVLPGLDLKVVDSADETVGPGQVGEIVLKGETVFRGYLADGSVETGNEEVFTRDGYYRSGDLGLLDVAGHVHVVGRRKDMINVGGEKVFGWEVEQVIGRMQGVKECAAFAMPDDVLGEVVEVAIVRTGAEPTADRGEGALSEAAGEFQGAAPRAFPGRAAADADRQGAEAAHRGANPGHARLLPRHCPPRPCRRQRRRRSRQAVAEIVTTYMAALTSERIDHDRPLFDVGLDSLGAMELMSQLEERFSLKVPPTLLYDHPTIRELAAYFASPDGASPAVSRAEFPRVTGELPATAEFPRVTAEFRRVTAEFPLTASDRVDRLLWRAAIGHRARCAPPASGDSRHQARGPRAEHRPSPGPVRPRRQADDHVPAAPHGTSVARTGAPDHHGGRSPHHASARTR